MLHIQRLIVQCCVKAKQESRVAAAVFSTNCLSVVKIIKASSVEWQNCAQKHMAVQDVSTSRINSTYADVSISDEIEVPSVFYDSIHQLILII
jgi:hypothetical protein